MDVLVAGAGVIGLAAGRALAKRGHSVTVAEAADAFGAGVSSRNSEVIHAGMYYPTASLRAYHCVRGGELLYEFCASHGVEHRRCGKLIVASSDDEIAKIEAIKQQGDFNGLQDLELLSSGQARRLEPNLVCTAALLSPNTGIVDSHGLMLALLGAIEDLGGVLAVNAPVLA